MCTSLTKKPIKPMIKNPTLVAMAMARNSFPSGLEHTLISILLFLANPHSGSIMCAEIGSFVDGAAAAVDMLKKNKKRGKNVWLIDLPVVYRTRTTLSIPVPGLSLLKKAGERPWPETIPKPLLFSVFWFSTRKGVRVPESYLVGHPLIFLG